MTAHSWIPTGRNGTIGSECSKEENNGLKSSYQAGLAISHQEILWRLCAAWCSPDRYCLGRQSTLGHPAQIRYSAQNQSPCPTQRAKCHICPHPHPPRHGSSSSGILQVSAPVWKDVAQFEMCRRNVLPLGVVWDDFVRNLFWKKAGTDEACCTEQTACTYVPVSFPSLNGELANSAVATGCRASPMRIFSTISFSSLKSMFTCSPIINRRYRRLFMWDAESICDMSLWCNI